MSKKRPPKGRLPTKQEQNLWFLAMGDVAPIVGKEELSNDVTTECPINTHSQSENKQKITEKTGGKAPPLTRQRKMTDVTFDDRSSQQMDGQRLRKMKQGKLPIEGTLDLHGMNQADAHAALNRFIEGAIRTKKRCVLVITGKGDRRYARDEDSAHEVGRDHSPKKGVLRRNLPLWLAQEPIKSMVLNVETARQNHGGSGACYIYLRKPRDKTPQAL